MNTVSQCRYHAARAAVPTNASLQKGTKMKKAMAAWLALALVPCTVQSQAISGHMSGASRNGAPGATVRLAQASEAAPAAPKAEAAKPKAPAQKAAGPAFEARKVDATDNVYIFRYGNVQAMFVVTSAGVIATDPISYANRDVSRVYLEEIRKITKQPVKYVVYSHHHFDHIAGGKPFKDAGAKFIAHRNAKTRLEALKDPYTVIPDEAVGDKGRTIKLGDTTLELHYLGRNHSDSTLIMRLPRDKIIFGVDLMPVGSFPGRAIIDSYPLEWENTLRKVLAMDWERMIPGHPGAPGGRLGTKKDVQDVLTILEEASKEVQVAAREGKCWDQVEKEFRMPKYENWPGYQVGLPMVARRYCGLWGRGT
jgi:glyoxylase-like metal-dependent hydrolase (beta-lactamase superfamily II)